MVEVTLSAIVLGAIFTTLPRSEYFGSTGFFTYFGNIVGHVQLTLPGVSFNGSPVVNYNLWTLPGEFHSYLIAALLIISGVFFSRTIFTAILLVATVPLFVLNVFFDYQATLALLPGDINVYYFFVGALFYIWRDKIPYSLWFFLPCLVLTYLLMFSTHTVYVCPILLTYVTVFIGLTALPTSRLIKSGLFLRNLFIRLPDQPSFGRGDSRTSRQFVWTGALINTRHRIVCRPVLALG